MILCINIGNSNIALGLCEVGDSRENISGDSLNNGYWRMRWRLSTVASRTVDEYMLLILPFLREQGVEVLGIGSAGSDHTEPGHARLEGVALASVVPSLTAIFLELARRLSGREAFVLSSDNAQCLNFSIDSSGEMGADLIANAVAGYARANKQNSDSRSAEKKHRHKNEEVKRGVIVVDFGTALTFTMVSSSANLLGVAISPGVRGALNSLAGDTAQLPHVELNAPPRTIGTNTIHSIQSGILFGFTGLVESMIGRIQKEMAEPNCVIATGGLHNVFSEFTNCFDYQEPWLQLEGIRLVYAQQRSNYGYA